MREQAKDVDQKFGLRQRIRLFRDDVQRKWPAVQRRWKAFSGSQLGSFTITAGVCYLFISGIAFRILNVLLGLFLLAPIGLTLLSSYNARRVRILHGSTAPSDPLGLEPFTPPGSYGRASPLHLMMCPVRYLLDCTSRLRRLRDPVGGLAPNSGGPEFPLVGPADQFAAAMARREIGQIVASDFWPCFEKVLLPCILMVIYIAMMHCS